MSKGCVLYMTIIALVIFAGLMIQKEDRDIENATQTETHSFANILPVPVKPKPHHKVPKPQLKYKPVTQKSLDSLNAIEATAKETASDYVDQPNHQIVNDAKRVIDIAETMKLLTVKDKTWYELDTELYDDQVTMFADVRHYESEQSL